MSTVIASKSGTPILLVVMGVHGRMAVSRVCTASLFRFFARSISVDLPRSHFFHADHAMLLFEVALVIHCPLLTLPTQNSNPRSLEGPDQLGKKTQLIYSDGKSNRGKVNSGSNDIELVHKFGRDASMIEPLWKSTFLANTLAAFIPPIIFFPRHTRWMPKDYEAFPPP
jgi:hypothetical protein